MNKQKAENIGWFIIGVGVAIIILSIITFFIL